MPRLPHLDLATTPTGAGTPDTLVLPVFRGGIAGPGVEPVLTRLGLDEVPRSGGFRGKPGELQTLATPTLDHDRIVLAGLGRMDELDARRLRDVAGAVTRSLASTSRHLATTLGEVNSTRASLRAVAEGLLLGAHRDDRYRTTPPAYRLERITMVVPSAVSDMAAEVVERAIAHAAAQCRARELVTTPAGDLGPSDVVAWAREHLPDTVEIEAWDERRLADEGCGGILGVGKGSTRPPRLLMAAYRPARAVASVALVGKGIVFDAGGLSLKSNAGMTTMKCDMAGAAAVLAVMSAVPSIAPSTAVTAYCPLAENLPSGAAQRPGDVLTARNGTTVQVLNTDAEGRLVLADALSLAAEANPDAIVDVATLTGAVTHAVGRRATGLFGNDDDLLRQLLGAADDAGEATWHLPLWDELRDNLESDVADLDHVNSDDRAGATIAGLFLQAFVDEIPWAHLDIAGSGWTDAPRGHLSPHGTGSGVRTLLRWLEAMPVPAAG